MQSQGQFSTAHSRVLMATKILVIIILYATSVLSLAILLPISVVSLFVPNLYPSGLSAFYRVIGNLNWFWWHQPLQFALFILVPALDWGFYLLVHRTARRSHPTRLNQWAGRLSLLGLLILALTLQVFLISTP
ncbi:MAG: hypothetical protein L0Z50_19225 [Verrucomicrobiales bacterium]|nr:hypothetical protein [Verrucomicrobiales bacterium]